MFHWKHLDDTCLSLFSQNQAGPTFTHSFLHNVLLTATLKPNYFCNWAEIEQSELAASREKDLQEVGGSPGFRVAGDVVLRVQLLHGQVVGEPTVQFLVWNKKTIVTGIYPKAELLKN